MKYELEKYTALYSELDWEYNNAMSGPYENLSFRSDEVTIIAGLKDDRITGAWRPVVAVGDDKLQKLHIERLYDICRNIYYMDFLIDGKLSVISQFLLRHGHKARPYYTQIIDLTKPKEELHAGLRKSYRSLTNKYHNVEYGNIIDYKIIHSFTAAKSRCKKSYEIQQKMIDEHKAFCLKNKESVVLVYYNQHSAYYAGGRTMPNFNSHAVIWQAIIRNKGSMFEMGEQIFSGDEKLMNISKFKRGFGGETKTRLILEKEK